MTKRLQSVRGKLRKFYTWLRAENIGVCSLRAFGEVAVVELLALLDYVDELEAENAALKEDKKKPTNNLRNTDANEQYLSLQKIGMRHH